MAAGLRDVQEVRGARGAREVQMAGQTLRWDVALRRRIETAFEKMANYKAFGGRGMSGQLLSDYDRYRRDDWGLY